jgi:hypothetical protein
MRVMTRIPTAGPRWGGERGPAALPGVTPRQTQDCPISGSVLRPSVILLPGGQGCQENARAAEPAVLRNTNWPLWLSATGGMDRLCICAALHSPFTYQLIAVKRPQWELEGTRLGPEAGKFGSRNKSGVCGIMQALPRNAGCLGMADRDAYAPLTSDHRSVCSSVSAPGSGRARAATRRALAAISESRSSSGSPPRSRPTAALTTPPTR